MRPNPDLKRYLAPLLSRRTDLLLVGRWLMMRPIAHYARCIYFDRSSAKGLTFPSAMIVPLYDRSPERRIVAGHELRRERKCWDLLERGGEDELCEALETRALPLIERVHTPRDFLEYVQSVDHWGERRWSEAFCHFILGEPAKADAILTEMSERLNWLSIEPVEGAPWPGAPSVLLHHLRTNPTDLLRIMHDWEAGMVRLMKLDRYWQRELFPCEATE